jgi:hypothetical protein
MSDQFIKLPKKWKIGAYSFDVLIVPTDDSELAGGTDVGNDGLTVFSKQVVLLDESMMPERAAVIVLHEAIHIINWVYGVSDDSTEEEVTTQLSSGLMAFWRDNPKVMQWLSKARQNSE